MKQVTKAVLTKRFLEARKLLLEEDSSREYMQAFAISLADENDLEFPSELLQQTKYDDAGEPIKDEVEDFADKSKSISKLLKKDIEELLAKTQELRHETRNKKMALLHGANEFFQSQNLTEYNKLNDENEVSVDDINSINNIGVENKEGEEQEKPKRTRKTTAQKQNDEKALSDLADNAGASAPNPSLMSTLSDEMKNIQDRENKPDFLKVDPDLDLNKYFPNDKNTNTKDKEDNSKTMAFKLGNLVGKAIKIVAGLNLKEKLDAHIEKNMSRYNEAERSEFPESVAFETTENNPKVEKVEEALKKVSKDAGAKMGVVKTGLQKVFTFFSKKEGESASLANVAEKMLSAAGVSLAPNARRSAFLNVLESKDVASFIFEKTHKDVLGSAEKSGKALELDGYKKTRKGFVNKTLLELSKSGTGAEIVADYIAGTIFVDLRDKICGSMRLYNDVRLSKINDSDIRMVTKFIDDNYMKCSPADVIEQLKRNPKSFEAGEVFGDKKVDPKFVSKVTAVIEKFDNYDDKIANIYGAMSTYVKSLKVHGELVKNLDITALEKQKHLQTFEKSRFKMDDKHSISFKEISEVVDSYMENEMEIIKEQKKAAINKDPDYTKDTGEMLKEIKKIERSMAPKKPRAKKSKTDDNVKINDASEAVTESVSENKGETVVKEKKVGESNKAFIAKRVQQSKEETPQLKNSMGF